MKQLFTIFIIFSFTNVFGQLPENKKNNNSDNYTLYVRFKNNIINENLKLKKDSKLQDIFKSNEIFIAENLNIDFSKLEKNTPLSKGNISLNALRNIYKINTDNKSYEYLKKLAKDLESHEDIEYVSLISNTPIAPPFIKNQTTKTDDLEKYQYYLEDNPGLNFKYAWSVGIAGQNINVIDVEYGFKKSHEMLHDLVHVQLDENSNLHPSLSDPTSANYNFLDHGTAVASIMSSSNDKIGLIGTSHKIKKYTCFLEWTDEGYDRVKAVSDAISNANSGDILIYEMQTFGNNDHYVPAEYEKIIWDLTKAATDAGIIVIAAAGNGNEDLDSEFYNEYINRGNSGAIIVGAGSSNISHSKMYFSSYGSRVDLQGWGENVLAAGYGEWKKYDNDNNRTYVLFDGTSSATPLVASVVTLVQSFYFEQTGKYLSPKEMLNLLKDTGIPQGGDDKYKNIGPLPNVKTAVEKLRTSLNITEVIEPLKIKLFPNPVKDFLNVKNNSKQQLTFNIINLNGISVLKGNLRNKIDISNLPKGTYIIKITDGKRLQIEKIIKN